MTTMGAAGRCRGCNALMYWGTTAKGAQMPLDYEPMRESETGGWCFPDGGDAIEPWMPMFHQGLPRYRPHWATCRHAEVYRELKGPGFDGVMRYVCER